MIQIGQDAFAVKGDWLLRWSPAGYTNAIARNTSMSERLLTPPLIVAILARGYRPRWHPSAEELMRNLR